MNASVFGGIFLIIGSLFLNKGNLLLSTLFYFLADVCWLILTINNHDLFGSASVIIGMIVGIIVFLKIHFGVFVKDLKKK